MQQEVVLAMLAKEPSQGYQLRARLNDALGPLGEALNAGQIYVTLGRLEKAGLLALDETAGIADPIGIVDAQRRELLRRLRDAQRAEMEEPDGSDAALLLEGIVLRLQADLRWLEACEANWTTRRRRQ
jgi:DNA-binding PadR family transcriptional regulator